MCFLSKTWDFWVALVASVAFGIWASPSIWSNISTELIAFFGIQAAAVLPVMIFAAGLLRPDGVTLEEARQYRKALKMQMRFWITILALDFISVILIISGKAVGWAIYFGIPYVGEWVNVGVVLSAVTFFFVSLTCMRMVPMVRGISSLQILHGDLTEKAIVKENRVLGSPYRDTKPASAFKSPEGYGRVRADQDRQG